METKNEYYDLFRIQHITCKMFKYLDNSFLHGGQKGLNVYMYFGISKILNKIKESKNDNKYKGFDMFKKEIENRDISSSGINTLKHIIVDYSSDFEKLINAFESIFILTPFEKQVLQKLSDMNRN